MNFFKINGIAYDVVVVELSESFNILFSENTGRTVSGGRMVLDPIGTFYGHKVKVKRKSGKELEYDGLFDFVSKPRYDGIRVEIAHNQTTISYDAYISNGERSVKRIDEERGKIYWDEMTLNIIPMEAKVIP